MQAPKPFNMRKIKIGVLISYDYKYFKHSLPRYYEHADKIVLAIDKDRKTWAGIDFTIENSFFDWIKRYDTGSKIEYYQDNFHLPELTTLENDSRERTMLGKFMGEGGWHIQVDADEYFIDFAEFVKELKRIEEKHAKDITIWLRWVTLFKKCENGYLYINNNEAFPVATTQPEYIAARVTRLEEKIIINQKVVHQSWARNEKEIWNKMNSWGHNLDFHPESYYNLWRSIDENNYKCIRNFHPLTPQTWPSLEMIPATHINELILQLKEWNLKNQIKPKFKEKAIKLLPYFMAKGLLRQRLE